MAEPTTSFNRPYKLAFVRKPRDISCRWQDLGSVNFASYHECVVRTINSDRMVFLLFSIPKQRSDNS